MRFGCALVALCLIPSDWFPSDAHRMQLAIKGLDLDGVASRSPAPMAIMLRW